MEKIAFASLQRERPVARCVTVTLIELASAPAGADASRRFMALVQQDVDPRAAAAKPLGDLPLTLVPTARATAEQRALEFIRRRLGAGDRLVAQSGFETWLSDAEAAVTLAAAATLSSAAAPPPGESAAVPPAVAALVRRFHPDAWKLLSPERQCRSVWRVGEYGDPQAADSPAQSALRALAPALVGLLGSGRHALLDLCVAVALARLGDPRATETMRLLALHATHPPTRRAAREAWLQLLPPAERQAALEAAPPDAAVAAVLDAWPTDTAAFDTLIDQGAQAAWTQALRHLYELALDDPQARDRVLAGVRAVPLVPGLFQGLRYLYKAAEMRLDTAVLAALHARFENSAANFHNRRHAGWARVPTGRGGRRLLRLGEEMARPQPRVAFGFRTRRYLQRRGLRTLRRLAQVGHPAAPRLAVALLLGLDDATLPAARADGAGRHYHAAAGWWLVPQLLLAGHPAVHHSAQSLLWWTTEPLSTDRALPERVEGLREMWDAHPEALLALALQSRCALVHAVAARALQDHAGWLAQQPATLLQTLLQSPHPPTARLALDTARTRLAQEGPADAPTQLPWWLALLNSPLAEAREFAWMQLARNPAGFARHPELVVALLLSAHEQGRHQGQGLAMLADPVALLAELQAALPAIDPDTPGLPDAVAALEALLQAEGPLRAAIAQLPAEPVLVALQHPSPLVLRLAVGWLLAWPEALRWLPPGCLTALLASEDPLRLEAGLRLLSGLSDEVLLTQSELLARWVLSPHARIRATVRPLLHRLVLRDAAFADSVALRLHEALFRSEPAEGVHDDALAWLFDELQAWAPARDPASVWRALQAQSRGAQRYGAWALAAFLSPEHFSLRQQATLVQHPEVVVRRWAMAAIEASLPERPTPEQAAQLMPLADTRFDDGRAFAHRLFEEQLTDETLPVTLLIDWVDHPQPWVQALGRSRLMRRMNAAEASLCLTRLSQHPSPQVQLFVTHWLLEKGPHDEDPSALAQRLRQLTPYLLTVLGQVHRGRVAKTRVIEYLRGCIEAPQTAEVVAELFARQVVTCSLTDKPQYIAGLRDIQRRHPHIALPFLRWLPAGSAPSSTSPTATA